MVLAGIAKEIIIVGAAVEVVVPRISMHSVLPRVAEQKVVSVAAIDAVSIGTADHTDRRWRRRLVVVNEHQSAIGDLRQIAFSTYNGRNRKAEVFSTLVESVVEHGNCEAGCGLSRRKSNCARCRRNH